MAAALVVYHKSQHELQLLHRTGQQDRTGFRSMKTRQQQAKAMFSLHVLAPVALRLVCCSFHHDENSWHASQIKTLKSVQLFVHKFIQQAQKKISSNGARRGDHPLVRCNLPASSMLMKAIFYIIKNRCVWREEASLHVRSCLGMKLFRVFTVRPDRIAAQALFFYSALEHVLRLSALIWAPNIVVFTDAMFKQQHATKNQIYFYRESNDNQKFIYL